MSILNIFGILTLIILFLGFHVACEINGQTGKPNKSALSTSSQYDEGKQQFKNPVSLNMDLTGAVPSMVAEYFQRKTTRVPKTKLPEIKPDFDKFLEASEDAKFIWLGHSTFLVNMGGQTILVDPVFESYASPFPILVKRFQAPVVSVADLPNIDVIVISHDHYDHLEKETIKKFVGSETKMIVPLGVGAHLKKWGVSPSQIVELDWWESTIHGPTTFTATPAQHFSGRGFIRNETLWAGWSMKSSTASVFYSGDSGYGDHYKEIGEKLGPFDLTFIENGQYNKHWRNVHQFPEEAIQAHLDVKGKAMVPVHWGMFELSTHSWFEPINRSHDEALRKGVRLFTPKIGQTVRLNQPNVFDRWWPEGEDSLALEFIPSEKYASNR